MPSTPIFGAAGHLLADALGRVQDRPEAGHLGKIGKK
jgi:hypothetical protein